MAFALGSGATLVLGGARSGKSRFAEGLVIDSGLKPVYVATAGAGDAEMAARIEEHRRRRGERWLTIEEPVNLAAVLGELARPDAAVLVDCLTLWLTNLMMRGIDIGVEVEELAGVIPALGGPVVFVSNEVGLGLVPDNPMGRAFRDHAGRLNQAVAERASQVFFTVAGLPLALKQ
jgi:adenosylcobinamide kinase/adenosylcobinamide-phosphate guanylyltransferase